MIDDQNAQDPALYPFYARTAETAVRLAMIRAAGRDFRPAAVTVEDVRWGTGIAKIAGDQLYNGAEGVTPMTERGKWVTIYPSVSSDRDKANCSNHGKITIAWLIALKYLRGLTGADSTRWAPFWGNHP